MEKEIIYEDSKIKVEATGHDYDFIATIFNKTNTDLDFFVGKDEEMACSIKAGDWFGILADSEGYETLRRIKEDGITYCTPESEK